jgi:hypothetical protein
MSWGKREVNNNFVALGDEDGQVAKVGGILVRLVKNTHFENKTDYEFVGKDGELTLLSGSASLARQLSESDVGKFFKAEFEGWGKSANGKFKQIAVYVWDGEPNDAMKAWPRFKDFYGKRPTTVYGKPQPKDDDFETAPAGLDRDGDDDLPF